MRIAIDALGIGHPGGIRSATLNLLEPLLSMDQENEYVVLVDRHERLLDEYANMRQIQAPVAQRVALRAWAQIRLPLLLRQEGVDLIHHTKSLMTLQKACPSVVTVHDLTMLVHPEFHPRIDVTYWRTVGRYCLRHVDHVIAVSQTTADDVMRYCGVAEERITVIHEGIDDRFKPAEASEVARVKKKYHLPQSYLLHVGSIWPKKNLLPLAQAYRSLVCRDIYDGGLVLVGGTYQGRGDPALERYLCNIESGCIIRTGPVPDQDLPALYTGAACFVFPSLHEGFGLVPLEAMACGTPVIVSRVGALEQTVADAGLFLDDPTDAKALADTIQDLLADEKKQEQMRKRGRDRARALSREEAARRTLALYENLAAESMRVSG
jgi:glycosyltransferase involved in cell wall biosynthesis